MAREFNAPVTVFISRTNRDDFKLQFFTPKVEEEICGHGTIAAFWVLSSAGYIPHSPPFKQLKQETKAGILPVDIHFDSKGNVFRVMMHQNKPTYYENQIDTKEIAEILRISPQDMSDNLPITNVSTGRPKLIIPVKNQRVLYSINPDFDSMVEYCKKINTTGFHVFTFETHLADSTTTARHFAPAAGVNEDIVTGNTASALGCYLIKYLNNNQENSKYSFVMEQGYNFNRNGKLYVEINMAEKETDSVKVGGQASILFQAEFTPLFS